MLLGNDALSWNVFSVSPEKSYGYTKSRDYSWYSYTPSSKEDMNEAAGVFDRLKDELKNVDPSRLDAGERALYRNMDSTITSYQNFYGSPYAADFDLIGGKYISSEGGYVADFASAVENYAFRKVADVDDLLTITKSTLTAFKSYLDFAADREQAGYPLYDVTLNEMQNYLNEITEQGRSYYLYAYLKNKINAVDFLNAEQKKKYVADYENALTYHFLSGVKDLSEGLEVYKGNVFDANESYLSAYGRIGQAYYEWQLRNKTGIKNANVESIYREIFSFYRDSYETMDAIDKAVAALETTKPDVYADFNAYKNGEKALLGLETPEQILPYLKTMAKTVVPDLKTEPTIDFKYMDKTVADISNTSAYYLKSPADEANSVEHITINPNAAGKDPTYLLVTMAHEGYPGHLYAYVNAKEQGAGLFMLCFDSDAFAEGWAMYVEFCLLDYIAAHSNDQAVQLFCNYYSAYLKFSYTNSLVFDLHINYFGETVEDMIADGREEENARAILEYYMGIPAVYVPYGYGMMYVVDLHDQAKNALGTGYNETEFNRALLSEGMGPTLTRASEITKEFIAANK